MQVLQLKAYYDSMKAQSPEEIFKLLNNAKTEEEYVLILVEVLKDTFLQIG